MSEPSFPKPTRGKIIVLGIYFWYPLAGVTYQFLHYLLGLRALGYDVYYVEDSQRDVYDPFVNDYTYDYSNVVKQVAPVLDRYGFSGKWCCRDASGQCFGMDEVQLSQLFRDADAALNVCAGNEIRDEHMAIKRRLYVESDPFAVQVRVALGDAGSKQFLDAHDTHFTFGENINAKDCLIPQTGHRWLPTRQPVHMDLWRTTSPGGSTFNTITTWHNKMKPIEWAGDTFYWTKDREFKKYLDLPSRRPESRFELACGIEPEVNALLIGHGWSNVDAMPLSLDADKYRSYIANSRGEFTVARDWYARPRTGWFSDRSVSYLAAGRPVITGETGFSKYVPSGRGLFAYESMDDILAAVDAIESDYAGQCEAARDVAAEYFASEKVLASLMTRAGLM